MTQAINELLQQAKIGSVGAFKDGVYNSDYKLSQEQVEVAALMQISSNLEESRKKCCINGFSLRDNSGPIDVQSIFNQKGDSFLDAIFNLTESINAAKDGKPAFFVVEDKGHYVTVALVPDENDPQSMSVKYINSITRPDTELLKEQTLLQNKFNNLPKNQKGSDEALMLQASIASISDTILEQEKMSKVGKDFADEVLKYLKEKGVKLSDERVLDRSIDQQFGNGCGLSVASNIAAITTNTPLFDPKDSHEKTRFYSDFGANVFSYIESASAVQNPLNVIAPIQESPLVVSKSENPKAKTEIDTLKVTQPNFLATQMATTIIKNHDLFQNNTMIGKNDFVEAIKNSQSLASEDRKSFSSLINKLGDKNYSKADITKLIASSDFVKEQVAAVTQIKQQAHNVKSSSTQSLPYKNQIIGNTR